MSKLAKHPSRRNLNRRQWLQGVGVLGISSMAAAIWPRLAAAESAVKDSLKVVAQEPWARIERLAPNLWSVISDPLSGNYQTVCNGGIVAGKERVLVVEAFVGAEGGRWVAEQARKLTGRLPTDVVISHYHGDHANGLAGFAGAKESPRVWVTDHTRGRIIETAQRRERTDPKRRQMLERADPLPTDRVTRIDLGGRQVALHPRSGHTGSDVTVEIEDPSTIFWGDLLWIGLFPNYMDAKPSQLAETVRATIRQRKTFNVTGHGPVVSLAQIQPYQELLDHVEAAARRSFEKGIEPADAAKAYKMPKVVADWHIFQPTYFETALSAWHRELAAEQK